MTTVAPETGVKPQRMTTVLSTRGAATPPVSPPRLTPLPIEDELAGSKNSSLATGSPSPIMTLATPVIRTSFITAPIRGPIVFDEFGASDCEPEVDGGKAVSWARLDRRGPAILPRLQGPGEPRLNAQAPTLRASAAVV